MTTINYGGVNRKVYYVDATMSSGGDGLTPQTAFKNLNASDFEDNSIYIFRRTPKSIYSTITGGTASKAYNIILTGMPISSDKMYAIIPEEAKEAWNTDENDNNESHASLYFEGNCYFNNVDDFSMFRIRVLHGENVSEWCITVGTDSSTNCDYFAKNTTIEKCEFTNVNHSLETTTNTFNKNYFARYLSYNSFNIKIKNCDVESNYEAFGGYSHNSHFENINALVSQQSGEQSEFPGESSVNAYVINDDWEAHRFSYHKHDSSANLSGGTSFVKNFKMTVRYNSSVFKFVNALFLSKNFSLENFSVEEAEEHIAIPVKTYQPGHLINSYARVFKIKNININLPKEQGRGIFVSTPLLEDYIYSNCNVSMPINGNYHNRIENIYVRYYNYGDDKSTFIYNYDDSSGSGSFDVDNFSTSRVCGGPCPALFDTSNGRPDYFSVPICDLILGDKTEEQEKGYVIAPYSYFLRGESWNFEADEIHAACFSVGVGANIHIKKLYTTFSSCIILLNNENYKTEAWAFGNSNCIVDEIISYKLTGSIYNNSAIGCYDRIMSNVYVGKSNVCAIPKIAELSRRGHCTITCANDIYTGNFISRSAYTTLQTWSTIYGNEDKVVLQFKNINGNNDRAWFGKTPFHLFGIMPTTSGLKYIKLRMSKVGFTNNEFNSREKVLQDLIRMNVTQNQSNLSDSSYAIVTSDNNWKYGEGYNVYIPVEIEDTTNQIYVDFNYTGNDETGTVLLHPDIELVDTIS